MGFPASSRIFLDHRASHRLCDDLAFPALRQSRGIKVRVVGDLRQGPVAHLWSNGFGKKHFPRTRDRHHLLKPGGGFGSLVTACNSPKKTCHRSPVLRIFQILSSCGHKEGGADKIRFLLSQYPLSQRLDQASALFQIKG